MGAHQSAFGDCGLRTTTVQGTKRIYPLTSIRFFAGIAIVLTHFSTTFWPGFQNLESHAVLQMCLIRVENLFACFASFFFLLSGYILAVVHLSKGREIEKRRFFESRFARIYPLFFVTLILDCPWMIVEKVHHYGWVSGLNRAMSIFMAHVVMVHGWNMQRLEGIDDPNWSLTAEVFFYVCFPVIGLALWRLKKRSQAWCAALAIYAVGVAISAGGLTWILSVWLHRPTMPLSSFSPVVHLSTFLLGVLVARIQSLHAERRGASISSRQANIGLALVFCGLLMAACFSHNVTAIKLFFTGILAPIFGVLIWGLSSAETTVSRLLSARWIVLLGNASFALYLIHIPVLRVFEHLPWQINLWVLLLYIFVCVGISVSTYLYFEMPAKEWMLCWFEERRLESAEKALIVP